MIGAIRNLTIASLIAISGLVTFPRSADSDTGIIQFGGNVPENNLCFIFIRREGTYSQSVDTSQLSSRVSGGISGVVDIFAIFPFQIFVDAPSFFINRPVGGDTGVTHESFFSGQALNANGVSFPERAGNNPLQLPRFFGATRLFVDLEATRSDAFPAGDYTSTATVRCE